MAVLILPSYNSNFSVSLPMIIASPKTIIAVFVGALGPSTIHNISRTYCGLCVSACCTCQCVRVKVTDWKGAKIC